MPTNDFDPGLPTFTGPRDADHPGYETQDVNVGGVMTFVAGLAGFVVIFFFFCFLMGKAINYVLIKQDGPVDKWHMTTADTTGATPHGAKRDDLTSNAVIEQNQLRAVSQAFPTPRLETDDGNQDTADLHAKEDLLLDNYSTSNDIPAGTVRIPIERAMELVLQRGLPKPATAAPTETLMVGDSKPTITVPLTDGFARTGYEQEAIETREQKNEYVKATGSKE
ncbi:hypothetical protein GOB94_07850 [Granulicella sp. 5B5]|uniref:hypothetical protein n=1 Tax=Granulicella sp. 5B5 TaxID=1617967 RepID=UPI0015F61531|nr:hypothetical protein [Granulicella sp. 5B5]QMV18606.1 hypothetical protein GOB94_07850 [Granulicella sp. 5B5]